MQSLTQPELLLKPFAQSGDKNTIPSKNTDAQKPQLADLTNGFPPITSEDPSDGGLPPERKDLNGLGYLTTTYDYFYQAGGRFTFSPTISSAIGGYPLNAALWYTDSNGNSTLLRSTVANNTNNFNSGNFTGWQQEIPVLGWSNTWTGTNTFSGGVALGSSATTDTISTDTDHSTKVVNSQWFRNAITNLGVQNLTKYEDIASSVTTYTAPIDGFIRVKIGATYNWQLYINGDIFQEQSRNNSDSCTTTWVVIPVKQGDVLTRGGSTYHFDGGAMWYPY